MESVNLILAGVVVGVAASFAGLGGGFLMVPLLLWLGYSADRAVGTSFFAILLIAVSAVIAHGKLANVDWRVGLWLAVGGIVGAQAGARLVDKVSTATFNKIFAAVLIVLGVKMLFQR
jgi:hypothetical protein